MSRTIALFCLILAATVAAAQDFYVAVNGAYGLGAGTQLLNTNVVATGTASTYEGVFGSLGEGAKFGVSGGYMFTNHFAAELGVSYWLGKKIGSTYTSPTSTASYDLSGTGFLAVPSLVFLSNLKPVNPYGKFGLIVGFLKSKQEVSSRDAGGTSEYTIDETGGPAIGFAGALGVIVPTGGAVDFFAEVGLHSLTYSPSKAELTKYTVNGQDRLPSVAHPSYDFKESFTNTTQNVNMAVRRPFSSIGFSAGVRLVL